MNNMQEYASLLSTSGGRKKFAQDLLKERVEQQVSQMSDQEVSTKLAELRQKQAEKEQINLVSKVASDYVSAGRFMARGFADELQKLGFDINLLKAKK